jgi:hypothetical protein
MPRVHTQRANKNYPKEGIKKGETYYWWQFRHSGKIKSPTYPKPSQLTQSEFWGTVYGIQEDYEKPPETVEELGNAIEDIKSRLEELRDEQESKKENMPEGLQNGTTGELLNERYGALDEAYNNIDCIDLEVDDGLETEKAKERIKEIFEEATDYLSQISCS